MRAHYKYHPGYYYYYVFLFIKHAYIVHTGEILCFLCILCAGNATASDLVTRTMTPDQMNTEALLQSRDYLAASTGFSDTAGNEMTRSAYSVHETGDWQAETGFSNRGDVAGSQMSTVGDTATEDKLRATFGVPRRVITIPTINQFDSGASGSDEELSEISLGH